MFKMLFWAYFRNNLSYKRSNHSKVSQKQKIQQISQQLLLNKNQQGLSYLQVKFVSLQIFSTLEENALQKDEQIEFQTMGEKWLYQKKVQKSFILSQAQTEKNQNQALAKIHNFKFNLDSQQTLFIRLENLNSQIKVPLKNFIANQIINEIQADLYPKDKNTKRESIGKIKFEVLFLKNVWLQVAIKFAQVSSRSKIQNSKNSKLLMRIMKKEKCLFEPLKMNNNSPHILKLGLTQHELYSMEFALEQSQFKNKSKNVAKLNLQNLNLLDNNSSHTTKIQLPSSQEQQSINEVLKNQFALTFQIFYKCKVVKKQLLHQYQQASLIQDL